MITDRSVSSVNDVTRADGTAYGAPATPLTTTCVDEKSGSYNARNENMSLDRYDTTVDVSSSFNYFPLVMSMTFSCQADLMEIWH